MASKRVVMLDTSELEERRLVSGASACTARLGQQRLRRRTAYVTARSVYPGS